MGSHDEVLVEVLRLQVLAFIRSSSRKVASPTMWDVARLLRLTPLECEPLIEELVDEGFVFPLPNDAFRFRTPLRLTPQGEGVLHWVHLRFPTRRHRLRVP